MTATVRDVGGDNAQSALIDDFEVGVLQEPPHPRRRVPRDRFPLEQGARERNRRRGHGDHDVASGFENATEFPERGGLVKELERLGRDNRVEITVVERQILGSALEPPHKWLKPALHPDGGLSAARRR